MVATRAGTVTVAHNEHPDGWYAPNDYGNWIEIDHGGGYRTRYAHLSQYGFAVSVGQYVYRGQRIANADDTGDSTADHLHFELRYNGTPVNPYAGAWVSGSPIPMGFRDQNGTVHGPYALNNSKIHNKWLALNGEPGSPLEDDWTSTCEPEGLGFLVATLYIQGFERGYIQYCASGSAEYVSYDKTYLPDAKIGDNGWNSYVIVRKNGGGAEVSVFFYDADGKVVDSRAYSPHLSSNATWTLDASNLASDWINPVNNFSGSGLAAGQDVSAVMRNHDTDYTNTTDTSGIGPPGGLSGNQGFITAGTTVYLPIAMASYYGWDTYVVVQNTGSTSANVTVNYYDLNGTPRYDLTQNKFGLAPSASYTFPPPNTTNFLGTAIVTTDQPVAVVVNEPKNTGQGILGYNGFTAGATTLYLPNVMSFYAPPHNFSTGFTVQNLSASHSVNIRVDYSNGTTKYDTIPPRGAAFHYVPNDLNDQSWEGSAIVTCTNCTSGQTIVAVINMSDDKAEPEYRLGRSASYNAFAPGSGTVVLPQVINELNQTGWKTSFVVQNTGSSGVTVTWTYYNSSGSQIQTGSDYVAAGDRKLVYQPNDLGSTGRFSVSLTAGGGSIVANVNGDNANISGDSLFSYNGFNR